MTTTDERARLRSVFAVMISSEVYGDAIAIARSVSPTWLLVEMPYAPPLGSLVAVHFVNLRDDGIDEMVARAEVRSASWGGETASARLIGLYLIAFEEDGDPVEPDRLH